MTTRTCCSQEQYTQRHTSQRNKKPLTQQEVSGFSLGKAAYLATGARDVVLHAIVLFGALRVVETIEGAN